MKPKTKLAFSFSYLMVADFWAASLAFWSVTNESTEFEQEKCNNGVLIEIGSGYAD